GKEETGRKTELHACPSPRAGRNSGRSLGPAGDIVKQKMLRGLESLCPYCVPWAKILRAGPEQGAGLERGEVLERSVLDLATGDPRSHRSRNCRRSPRSWSIRSSRTPRMTRLTPWTYSSV